MKYCPKCRLVYPDSREQCRCGRILKYYEALRGDTPVRVARTSGLEKDRITGALADAGIPYSETPVRERNMSEAVAGQGSVEWELCVPYEALEQAREALYGIGAGAEEEPGEEASQLREKPAETPSAKGKAEEKKSGQWEEMSNQKRWFWRILSMILFFLLVWGVVSATDWVMALIMGNK